MPVTPRKINWSLNRHSLYISGKKVDWLRNMLEVIYGLSKSTVTLKLEKSLRFKTKFSIEVTNTLISTYFQIFEPCVLKICALFWYYTSQKDVSEKKWQQEYLEKPKPSSDLLGNDFSDKLKNLRLKI